MATLQDGIPQWAWTAIGLIAVGLALPSQAVGPTFRSLTQVVSVPVSVRDGNTPVQGLTAEDFELRDNGALRDVAHVASGDVPIDLTVIVDIGGGVGREIDQFLRDIDQVPDLLGPVDRVRILTVDFVMRAAVPWSRRGAFPDAVSLAAGGRTTLNDAIAAALMSPVSVDRRQLAVTFQSGLESASGVHTSRLVDLAARSHVALSTYQLDPTTPQFSSVRRDAPGMMGSWGGLRPTTTLGRLPSLAFEPVRVSKVRSDRIEALEEVARRSGGEARDYGGSASSSLRRLLEEFRESYVLYFEPADSADDTWHELSVEVRRPGGGGYSVRARPGYMSVTRPAALPTSTGYSVAGPPETLVDWALPAGVREISSEEVRSLLDRYAGGNHELVVATLRGAADMQQMATLLRREGQRWVDDEPTPSARRRTVLAALALEVASPSYPLPFAKDDQYRLWRTELRPLLTWGGELLSQNARVDDVERAWHLAAVASLQGMLQFRHDMRFKLESQELLELAMARDPNQGRHRWADVQILENWWENGFETDRARPDEIEKGYAAAQAVGDDDVRAEVQLHVVDRVLRANINDEPLGPIVAPERRDAAREAIGRTVYAEQLARDPFVVYMSRFFRARLYDRLDMRSEAEAAYGSALEVYPSAQSASMPLATLLFLRGEDAAAQTLVDNVLAHPGAADPWRIYFLQDYRRLPLYIEQMRAALQASR